MLNNPKTGSTFARKAISLAYDSYNRHNKSMRNMIQLQLPNIRVRGSSSKSDQHGTYQQIPISHREKPVFSIMRHPVNRLISSYNSLYWKYPDSASLAVARAKFPHFPELSLAEYLDYEVFRIPLRVGFTPTESLGPQSIHFIQMFFRDPRWVLRIRDLARFEDQAIFEYMGAVQFLRQEHLRSDIAQLLMRFGFSEHDLAPVYSIPNSNCSHHRPISNEELLCISERVTRQEGLLFRFAAHTGLAWVA